MAYLALADVHIAQVLCHFRILKRVTQTNDMFNVTLSAINEATRPPEDLEITYTSYFLLSSLFDSPPVDNDHLRVTLLITELSK
jgi:hypothetical protein